MKIKVIPPMLLLAGIILIVTLFFIFPRLNFIPFPWGLAGLVLIYGGIALNGKARELFRKYDTPHKFQPNTALIEEGIFTRTRNPMYLGMTLFLLGIALCFGNAASCIVPVAFGLSVQVFYIPYEEKRLASTFGEKYMEYKSRVPRWI
jgi:protein-S-isoprenylcysteine O-methyltransferase Ste14